MRAERAQVSERFDKVGLALAIAADKQVRAGDQGNIGGFVVAEVRETESGDDHDDGGALKRDIRSLRFLDRVPAELVTERSDRFHRR